MSVRDFLNRNPQVSVVVAAIVVVLAVGTLVLRSDGNTPGDYKYSYYMMPETGAVIVEMSGQHPPLKNGAVRAVVFSCSDCSDKSTHFVGWLEKYTDQAKAAMKQLEQAPSPENPNSATPSPQMTMAVEQGRLMAAPPDGGKPQWVPGNSRQAQSLRQGARQRCADSLEICSPLRSERP